MKNCLLIIASFIAILILSQPAFSGATSGTWVAGPNHPQEAGSNRLLVFVTHARSPAAGGGLMRLDAVTYGKQAMTKVVDCNTTKASSGTIYTVAYVLNEAGIEAADANDANFVLTWAGSPYYTPTAASYSSSFLTSVVQDVSIGATGTKSALADAIALDSGLANDVADLVVLAASEQRASGSYTMNNYFTKGLEQSLIVSGNVVGDGVIGYKTGTGTPETPSVTFVSGSASNSLLGFVVKGIPDFNMPIGPNPVNFAINVSANTSLSWGGGANASYFDVYLGTDPTARNNPVHRVDTNSYTPASPLAFSTTYYWAVDANANGTIYSGATWNFTTVANKVSNPTPADGAANVAVSTSFSWDNAPGWTSYNIYLGTDSTVRNNPKTTVHTNSYTPPENLQIGLRYYWVVDVNYNGTIYPGDTWTFTSETAVDANYLIATWRGFTSAAVTYTFDDAPSSAASQIPVAIPMLNSFGFHGTFNLVTTWQTSSSWISFGGADANGHEIASHYVTHENPTDLPSQNAELQLSQQYIEANIPGCQCLTTAYPNCVEPNEDLLRLYYIAGRICSSVIAPTTPSNFFQLPAFITGQSGINTLQDWINTDNSAASQNGWAIYLTHALDSDSGYSPTDSNMLRQSLAYLDAHRDTFWVDSMVNVVKYIKERNNASLVELSHTDSNVVLRVSITIDSNIYNLPLSVRKPLPANWKYAYGSQNGIPTEVNIIQIGSQKYMFFDAIPSGGNIVLQQSMYGDFDDNRKVDTKDLKQFADDYWLVTDCNQWPLNNGTDANSDCITNFYEFSRMAGNWMKSE